ncbi:hypothetical protein [Micromonospora rhizosphaerae]|uniref:hypothetical protein n=1 Tax=Micromonospora rhizosphaerae TaxID=568872 RepID=UPI001FDF8B35|nr:hypothetical protein [Micromonospora rhizosphaerae]
MPSPPQTKISSAPFFSALRTFFGALRLFGSSYQMGSSTPAPASSAHSSSRPPPRVFRRWATTATVPTRAAATRSAPTAVLVLMAAGVTQPIRSVRVGCLSPRCRRL